MLYKQKETHVNHKQTLDIESLVPQNHLVRKLNKIDLSFIYDMVESLYAKNGPLSIDPVLLFKILIIQHVFGISSMRRTITEIEVNVAYRWYLGLNFTDKIPHHSTFGKNYEWRFKDTQIFNNIFSKILELIRNNGFIDDTTVFIDGTHVKANANNKKAINKTIEIEEHPYQKDIDAAITESRKLHNKKPLKEKTTIEHKDIKSSTTDPDCGLFHKGEHKIVFAYTANVCCDRNNFILDLVVFPGNVYDSRAFVPLYEKLKDNENIKYVAADAGYKTPSIAKDILESNKIPVFPCKRPMTKKGFFKKNEYIYNKETDIFTCPNNCTLTYSTTNRDGYIEYKSNPKDCEKCPYKNKCTESKTNTKTLTLHVFHDYMNTAEGYRLIYKNIYKERSQTIERVFADGKENHNLRYTRLKGLQKVTDELTFKFACMNLKKLVTWLDKSGKTYPQNPYTLIIYLYFIQFMNNNKYLNIKKTTYLKKYG